MIPNETQIHRLWEALALAGGIVSCGAGARVDGIVYVPETNAES